MAEVKNTNNLALEFEEIGENGSRKFLNQTSVTSEWDTQIASQSAPLCVRASARSLALSLAFTRALGPVLVVS